MSTVNQPFRKLKFTPLSEKSKVIGKPPRDPVNFQAAKLMFPAPWWSKLADKEAVGRHISELESLVVRLREDLKKANERAQWAEKRVADQNKNMAKLRNLVNGDTVKLFNSMAETDPAIDKATVKVIDFFLDEGIAKGQYGNLCMCDECLGKKSHGK